jgi:hypothetical protein
MSTCRIILKDEVNTKIDGLDVTTRNLLKEKFSFMLPYAYHVPAFKLGRWDGKVNYFTVGGLTYTNLLEEIIPILISKGYSPEIVDQRNTHQELIFPEITADHFSDKQWPVGHPMVGQPIVIRDYQVAIINQFLSNPQCLQEIATGAGKTLITACLSNITERFGRSIVIVPNKDLVNQTEEDYINLGLDVGVYFGDRKDFGKTHTICTWQSLDRIEKDFKSGKTDWSLVDFADGVSCVMVDECFAPSSLVLTPDGYRPIKDINQGDTVINYCEETNAYKEDKVVDTFSNMTKSSTEDMLELEFDDGTKIEVTANHKFLTVAHGWVRADQLNDEMEVKSINTSN